MAGQGLNLGLLDANILANTICKAINEGRDFSKEDILFEYEKKAKLNNYSMQGGLEVIKTAYSLNSEAFGWVRNLGVEVVQNTPLRKAFQTVASGELYDESRTYWKN
jgi:2-polyprenyl-6-methoxyphenol hydroxylase-like FAD-dependent oxidoreductase